MKNSFFSLIVVALLISCSPASEKRASPNDGLLGVWSWSKLAFSSKDTSYVWNDLDGQIIFTDKYYSTIYINRSVPRDTTAKTGVDGVAPEQLREIFRGVVANSGSYSIEGDSILFFRDVALWPNAMASDHQPSKLRIPHEILKDSLVWKFPNGFEYVWVRRK